ncbi:MAG TPA: biopolymer transporter ExbD [Polyangiales bacterium]|nr:biopolymer transporter ExbD [Polyangiales bacterium]
MAASSQDDGEITGINVTPLVDVTLVLLIIFMVTAKLVMSQAMPLDLPKAATAGETQTVYTVTIDGEGVIAANGVAMNDDAALRASAQRAQRETPELRAVLSASARVNHGRVMHVLDVLREVGVAKVAFGAEKSE